MARNKDGFPAFSLIFNIFAIPCNFLIGFIVGVGAPAAAIAGIVAGIKLLTGKVPFVDQAADAEGETMLTLKLVPVDEAKELYAEEKDRLSEELGGFQTEIKAIIEEAKAAAGEVEEAPAEEG